MITVVVLYTYPRISKDKVYTSVELLSSSGFSHDDWRVTVL